MKEKTMYFKKTLSLMLFLCLILSLASCDRNSSDRIPDNGDDTAIQNEAEPSATEVVDAPDPTGILKEKASDLSSFGQDAYGYVEYFQENLNARLAGTEAEKKAADYLISVLKAAGYTDSQIEVQTFQYFGKEKKDSSQNVIVTKKGTGDKVIAVGAHYDCADTHGVEDNASGVSVVMENAVRLKDVQMPYTIKFIFFGTEEIGLVGSGYYVNSLSKEEMGNIGLMINLDSIMTGNRAYLFGGTAADDGTVVDTWAVEQAKAMADELGLETYFRPDLDIFPNPSPVAGDGSDQASFKKEGIPYVYYTSASFDLPPYDGSVATEAFAEIMHTPNDDLDILYGSLGGHMEDMLKTYSILLYHMLLNIEMPE
jgi:Zn-dependent M28 family amino/carboxypeptidase